MPNDLWSAGTVISQDMHGTCASQNEESSAMGAEQKIFINLNAQHALRERKTPRGAHSPTAGEWPKTRIRN